MILLCPTYFDIKLSLANRMAFYMPHFCSRDPDVEDRNSIANSAHVGVLVRASVMVTCEPYLDFCLWFAFPANATQVSIGRTMAVYVQSAKREVKRHIFPSSFLHVYKAQFDFSELYKLGLYSYLRNSPCCCLRNFAVTHSAVMRPVS